jgi:hypothetical protein
VVDSGTPLQNIHFAGAYGISALYVRSTCDLRSTQLDCTSTLNDYVDVYGAAGGSDLYVFAEGTAATNVSIMATATPVTVLNEGEACDPTNHNAICNTGLLCVDGGTSPDACAAPSFVAGELTASDPTWTRTYASCSASTSTVHYDLFTVTNNGGDSQLTAYTRKPGDSTSDTSNFDSYIHIYSDPFDPAQPTTGCINGDDDGGPGSFSLASAPIAAGQTVDVIVSGYGATSAGVYELGVAAPGSSLTVTAQ